MKGTFLVFIFALKVLSKQDVFLKNQRKNISNLSASKI